MSKINLLGATMHTAGIYSDMTVDGPEIGTLVVIVDRAKNLPNRKTIGKQDPYCAARLGKEAKKTETDRRGGQTPRWDQEMRFTVHDSPDYYQLKVSVFNDDKKTEIIGETWISLSEVVVPGGGKNDLWHNLSFKGKYAGEIRIEITYYDSRPKPEKSPDKKKQAAAKEGLDASRDPMGGPRQMKPVKRRPLPSNPTMASPSPVRPAAAVPGQGQASARGRALPALEPGFDHSQTHAHPGARGLPASDYAQDHTSSHAPSRGRPLPGPETVSDYAQTPPRGRLLPQDYQPNQSPLQQVEYNTPPPRFPQSNSNRHTPYDTNVYHSPLEPLAVASHPTPLPVSEKYESYDPATPGSEYTPGNVLGRYDDSVDDGDVSPRMTYHAQPEQSHYALPAPEEYGAPLSPTGPPPLPPLHGTRRASPLPLPPPVTGNDAWDMPNFSNNVNSGMPDDPYDPSRHVKHRQSMPAYAHAKSYQAYSPPREQQRPQSRDQRPQSRDQRPQSRDQYPPPRQNSYDDRRDQRPQSRDQYGNTPRHHSYDDRFHNGFESMQPTVEDAPPSPGPGALSHPNSGTFSRGYDDRRFDQVPSPAPLNLGGRGSAASGRQSASTQFSFQMSNGFSSSGSPASFMDRTQNSSLSSHRSSFNQQYQPPRRRESEDRLGGSPGGPSMPQVPSSLVAGMDPMIAQDISERIYSDKRGSFSNAGTFPRNSYHPETVPSPYQQPRPTSSYGRQDTSSVFVPASTPSSYSQHNIRENSPGPMGSQRDSRVPMRKSVSPAPNSRDRSRSPAPPRERRLSGVPFGPDDYDALNPNVGSTASKSGIQFSGAVDSKGRVNPDEKIIAHDGREIDPSDYLPVDTYAAEYEKKVAPKPTQPPLQTAASLALARPRSQGRPYSMVPASNSSVYMIKPANNPSPGRTRLQKKSARTGHSAQIPAAPLTPITSYHDNANAFTPRSVTRTSTGDFQPNENYAPSNALSNYGNHHTGSYGGNGGRGGSAPPIPAKVPMNSGGGMGHHPPRLQATVRDPGEQAWSLLEEMKSIDLGTGSSRTRHGRKGW